ncbi:O-linked N-acetylglucosamine transferase family protein [Vreelandella aquamarina]|uniref:protein O-GlcNAc transferase n=1 Tax=Vreelandella aquamarina TaxID=77097 RepID=A0A6F8SYY4_9GAMM|nr:glycosyltransferase [Halomonas meridiana]BCA93127.1 hypothetical protein HMSLTHF_29020 [Halomonas meridiana]
MARPKAKKLAKKSKKSLTHTNDFLSCNTAFQKAYNVGDFDQALKYADWMVSQFPKEIQGWVAKADGHARLKQFSHAIDCLLSAKKNAAKFSIVEELRLAQYQVLGGQAAEALPSLIKLSEENIDNADIYMWLSQAYHVIGKNDLAIDASDKSLAINDKNIDTLLWRSRILDNLRRHTDAKNTLLKIKKISPKTKSVSNHLGSLALREGDYDQAERHFDDELRLQDNGIVFSSKIVAKHYNPKYDASELKSIHEEWASRYQLDRMELININNKSTKKIRVGMLSGGFRLHPVGQMMVSMLKELPDNEIELFFYSTNQVNDFLTVEIKKYAASWKIVESMPHRQLSDLIAKDKVDILIDMNGGGDGSRYQAVSRKPAPIIVKWVGMLINTTGIKAVDYLLSDHFETPEGYDTLYTEKLIRLPDDYICYSIPKYIPKGNALPALSNQHITFGCLNNPAKLSVDLIKEWSQLLLEIPDSKLLLRGVQFEGVEFCQKIIENFKRFGIQKTRLILEGPAQHKEFIETYHRIDIALDTWPYSGGLTTCEALAMGVPVVTHVGPTFAGRHSATHLANAGLPELVTDNWDDFRKRAKELAADLPSLAVIRAALRTILIESPVCDGERFAQHFTKAMRGIWQRYCEGKAPEALTFNKEGDAWFADEAQPIELVEVEAEPEPQEAEFEWNLESPITVIDNGALFARHPKFTEWMQTGNFAVITFDPGSLLTKQADELKQLGEWHHYPHATLGDGKDATLYATLDPELTGTLQPVEEQQTGEQDDPLRVLSTLPISTVALNAIEGLSGVDLLVLDSLNDAMAILENGHTYLANTLLLQVKLAFQPTHQRQPNLAEVQHRMARHGFRFYRFNNEQHRSYLPESVPAEKRQATELTIADAIFLPSHERMASLANHQKTKLAFLLHTIYGIKDMAYELLFQVDEEQAQRYWAWEGVVEKKCLVSSLSKEASKENNSYGFVLEKYKESIDYLDVKDALNYSYSNPTGVAVVMPCIDKEQGLRTAATLIDRAGMPVKVIVAFDSLQQGFIKTLNLVSKKCKVKYVIYLAQDAFPGRGWLASAYNALEKSGRGLLAFNDGKWSGRIASFGMVRKSWAYSLYNESILCAEYNSHCADDELTIIARCNNELYYDPEIVLIEVDYNKGMVGGGNAQDRSKLYSRAENFFEGKVKERTFSKIAPEYNLKRVKSSIVKRGLASDVVKELVSIVMPAYKSRWFEEALKSALSQEKVVFEIIICDDSSDDKIKNIVDKYSLLADGVIRYYKNESPLGEVLNLVKCIEKARGDFIKPLYDDDVLNPYASFELLRALNCSVDVALASSRRQVIDENSDLISESPIAYAFPFSTDVYIDGKSLVSIFAHGLVNFIGEPSCVMFKRELAKSFGDKFYSLAGHPIAGRGDLAAWMNLLRVGDLVMLNKPLSFFRVSDQQTSQASRINGNTSGIAAFKKMIRQLGWYDGKDYIKAAPLKERSNLIKVDLFSFWRTGLPINFGGNVAESNLHTSSMAKLRRELQSAISSGESLKILKST